MTKKADRELTLHDPTGYQVRVPGHLDESWSEWVGGMTITFEGEDEDAPVTILSGIVDQAALHGLLRQLYAMGLPVLSVSRVEPEEQESDPQGSQT